jgi:NADH-quinone oxidoreductase subunit L
MLIGCLAIAGVGVPFVLPGLTGIGLSGFYSKDAILEQGYNFMDHNPGIGAFFFWAAAGGAAITAFYMFRMWYMTFLGKPRNHHRYEHAHESPWIMVAPLVVLSVFAIGVAWPIPGLNLVRLLSDARFPGTDLDTTGALVAVTWPSEHLAHNYIVPATLIALGTSLAGIGLATVFYVWRPQMAGEAKQQFGVIYRFLINKWWFDELYDWMFVRPTHVVSGMIARFDRNWIDRFLDGTANTTRRFAVLWERLADQVVVDGFVNVFAGWTYSLGLTMRRAQRGNLREYVLYIVAGTVIVFVLISVFRAAVAG